MTSPAFPRAWLFQLTSALLFIASLILVNANVESGMNDDWSFVLIARDLAATGYFHYNGWAAPLIGFQAYWAALFIKLFGFSFFAVRASIWLLTVFSIPALWRLLRIIELRQWQAFAALNFFLLSPLVLPNVATFMTDLPAFYLFSAALLSTLHAWRNENNKSALLWAIAATCFGILSGSVRQVYWLAAECFLLTLAVARFRSIAGRLFIFACMCCIALFGAAASFWLLHQAYVPADTTLAGLHQATWRHIAHTAGGDSVRNFTGLAVLCLPVTLPNAWQSRRQPIWVHFAILVLSSLIPYRLANPIPWLGNTVTNYGVMISGTLSLGDKPEIMSGSFMFVIALLGLASAFYSILGLTKALRGMAIDSGVLQFAVLTLPFLLLYALVLAVRASAFGVYDRYLIPALFVALALTMAVSVKRNGSVSLVTATAGTIFALYAIATTHDYFSEARARLDAANEILKGGHDRTSVLSGFEFDSWTQVQQTGYINNEQIQFPSNAYRQLEDCNGSDDLQAWWRPMVPALKARYLVTLTPVSGARPSEFPAVSYQRWLPWGLSQVFVERVIAQDDPLVCKPDTGS